MARTPRSSSRAARCARETGTRSGPGTDWLRAGVVGKAHGLDGSFYVREPKPQLLKLGAEVVVGEERHRVVRRAGTEARPIVRVDGCGARSDAEALRGQQIRVARSEAPELEPDEWWADDLEGCTVHDSGRMIGTVRRLLAWPSCEVLEVARAQEDALLVPLVAGAVRTVDVSRHEIEIDLRFLGQS